MPCVAAVPVGFVVVSVFVTVVDSRGGRAAASAAAGDGEKQDGCGQQERPRHASSFSKRSASSNGPISARRSAFAPMHVLRDALHVLGGDRVDRREHLVRLRRRPSSTSRRSPKRIRPCGFSSWSTKRPFAKFFAFSSSSAGTGSSTIRSSSSTIVVTASSIRLMSTPACE